MKLKNIFKKKVFKYSILAVIIIVFLSVVFIKVDFNASKSETSINSTKETFAASESEIEADISEKVFLYVEDGALDGKLYEKLRESLKQYSSEVLPFLNLKENFGGPTVAVKILRDKIDYTPFYAKGEIDVLFFYSSSGDTTYFEKFVREEFGGPNVTVIFKGPDGPQKIAKGNLALRDTSYGILTVKGYERLLAERIAERISNEVREVSL